MRTIRRYGLVPDGYIDSLLQQRSDEPAKLVDDRHYDDLISREDADVYRQDDDSPVIVFRTNVLPEIPPEVLDILGKIAQPSDRRWDLQSGIGGYHKLCGNEGHAGFTKGNPEEWQKVEPFLEAVDSVFRSELPEEYNLQLQRTEPEWRIPNTGFSTVTVNRTSRFPVHCDKGNMRDSYSCLTVFEQGDYDGGYLVFPSYRVAVDIREGDLLIVPGAEPHGNTAITGDGERMSIVCYYREELTKEAFTSEDVKASKFISM